MLKISDYEFINTLYNSKNITEAARTLLVSQPALTKRLKQIEQDLGITIVHRNINGVYFTEEGKYFVLYCQKCIEDYKELKMALHGITLKSRNTIRIASATSIAHGILPDLLYNFHRAHRDIQIQLQAVGSSESCKRVHNRENDIGFICGESPWIFKRIFIRREFVTLITKTPTKLKMLPFLPRISPRYNDNAQQIINNWWHNNFDIPSIITMNLPNIFTCVEMVKRGLGYSILMDKLAYRNEDLYQEVLCDKHHKPLQRNEYMIYNEEIEQKAPFNIFIKYAKEYFSTK